MIQARVLCTVALFSLALQSYAAVTIPCDDYRAIKSASESRFSALQTAQDGHNFWSSSKTLPGAANCRIYHSDEGDYHTAECSWRGMTAIAAEALTETLKADVSRCLEPINNHERKPSARFISKSVFGLLSSPAFDVDAYVTHSASSDNDHVVQFEIARSDAKDAAGSAAGTKTSIPSTQRAPEFDMAVVTLQVAAQNGDIATINQALNGGVSIDAMGMTRQTSLWGAAYNNQLSAVLLLLKRGANVNTGVATGSGIPFQAAILGGHFPIAKALLTEASTPTDARGPGVSTLTGPLLLQVVDTDDSELLKTFIARAINIDVNEVHPITGWSALDSAIFSKKYGQAVILARDLHGWQFAEEKTTKETTLFNAVNSGSVEITKVILDNVRNIDLSKKNFIGQTVLDLAADNPAMLKVLLSNRSK